MPLKVSEQGDHIDDTLVSKKELTQVTLSAKKWIGFKWDGDTAQVNVPDLQILLGPFETGDQHIATGLLIQAVSAARTQQGCEVIMAIIEDLHPRDPTERLLAVQIAVTHTSLMAMSAKMNDASALEEQEVFERSFNCLARTFTAQTEALRKPRTGRQSKVTVEYVTVSEGGQAIVGSVERGPLKSSS